MNQTEYNKRFDQITDWLAAASKGNYVARAQLKEALSTSDFPVVFADIKDAQFQARYAEEIERGIWNKIARRLTVPNFLPQSLREWGFDWTAEDILAANGGRRTIPGTLPNVPEGTEYPTTTFKLMASAEQLEIRKAGARVPFTFEAIINDQWDAVDQLPNFLVNVAIDSEDAEVTSLLTDGSGPNSEYFTSGRGNLLEYGTNTAGTAALTRDTLKAALWQADSFYAEGNVRRPIRFGKFAVVIPSALEQVAADIQALPTQTTIVNGNTTYVDTFSYGKNFEFVVDPWLDAIDTVTGDTAWYVVPFAGQGARTSLALGFLQGYERPELRVHNSTGLYIGGGAVPPREGSFRNDDWELRIRHIYGGVALANGEGTVASTGTAAPTTA
jgi:hypothetical protein